MKKINLDANIREQGSNRLAKRLRKEESVPGVLYERGSTSTPIKVDKKELSNIISKDGMNIVVQLNLGDREVPAIIKEVQRNPIDRSVIHVDFQPVSLHEVIHAEVPILVINGERIEKSGMVINRQMGHIEIEGEVEKLPRNVTIDASKLKLGDVVKVADIEIAEEISIITNKNDVVLSVKPFKEEPIDLVFDRTEPEMVKNEEK